MHEADLDLGGDGLLFVLEAVARTDVDELDLGGEFHGMSLVSLSREDDEKPASIVRHMAARCLVHKSRKVAMRACGVANGANRSAPQESSR
ncbi:hypothetical protein GmRootV118_58110 [Variovorax sp. V118]